LGEILPNPCEAIEDSGQLREVIVGIPKDRIQTILDNHIKRGVVGASLAISMPGEETALFTSGLADKFKKTPMRTDHTFRIASCTKNLCGDRPSFAGARGQGRSR
jgi:CubicO group peptidase (beta-lactamase class C family)